MRGYLRLSKRCGWLCSVSPVMLVVREDVSWKSIILRNHGMKVYQATEESLRKLAGDIVGSDVVQNKAATEMPA